MVIKPMLGLGDFHNLEVVMDIFLDDNLVDDLLWGHISSSSMPNDFLNYLKQLPLSTAE